MDCSSFWPDLLANAISDTIFGVIFALVFAKFYNAQKNRLSICG